jgi:hypothetical protein
MSILANVFLGKCLLGRCLLGKCRSRQMSLGKCLWANSSGQMSYGQMSGHRLECVVYWSKLTVTACLEGNVSKIVSFSMDGMCRGQNGNFEHIWNVHVMM